MAHSEQEILTIIADLVNEQTGIATEEVQPAKSFTEDLDIDSLTMTSVVVEAEDKFSINIPDEDVVDLRTVQDVVSYVQKAQA